MSLTCPYPVTLLVHRVLLCVNQKMYSLARQITEAYLTTIPEGMLIHLETAAGALTSVERGNKDPLMTHYERLVELYVVHVLTKLNEWDSARQFLEYNTVLSDSTKKVTFPRLYPFSSSLFFLLGHDLQRAFRCPDLDISLFRGILHDLFRHTARFWKSCCKNH